jgi:hypothetical protein
VPARIGLLLRAEALDARSAWRASESLGQDLRVETTRGTDRVPLESSRGARRDDPHGRTVIVSLLDVEILVAERVSRSSEDVETEPVGRQVADRRIGAAQILGGYLLDARIFEDRAKGRVPDGGGKE